LWNEEVQTAYVSWNPARYQRERVFETFVLMDESSYVIKEVTGFMTVMDELSFYLNRFCPVLKLLSPIQKPKECAQTRISERYVEVFI